MLITAIRNDNEAVLTMNKCICFCFIIIAALTFTGCASVSDVKPQDSASGTGAEWGIQIIGIRPTAAGMMLNLRYRVTDPEKAISIVGLKAKPYIIDQATGKTYMVPKMPKVGALRQRAREAQKERTYFILFTNTNREIKSGDMIALAIGDLKIENLKVE